MVARMWHGRTPEAKSAEYTTYLYDQGIKKIRAIPGNLGAQVLRRNENGVTDFIVISYWNSREDIKKFAGNDIEKTHNLPRDQEFLLEMEPHVKHYDLIVNEWEK
jgi:heme-degrading monooxygenase HmoA